MFEIHVGKDGKFYWHLRAANGQIVADSGQGYARKEDCHHGIEVVKQLASGAPVKDLSGTIPPAS
jgi:uncharacterized protein YegP (UPF0339 family)